MMLIIVKFYTISSVKQLLFDDGNLWQIPDDGQYYGDDKDDFDDDDHDDDDKD